MTRRAVARAFLAALISATLLISCARSANGVVRVGLMYPTSGPQGAQGIEEQRGAELAAKLVNAHGGVRGRQIELVSADLDTPEDVPAAMARLQAAGVAVVVGTHGSEYSVLAAAEATRRHMLVWETGAVGETGPDPVAAGVDFIRMAPMGGDLGKAAVDFVATGLAAELPVHRALRWAIAYVDDPYGRAVAAGAAGEVRATGQPLVGLLPYGQRGTDFAALAQRIAALHPDALYVSAYLADGTALRSALAGAKVPLVVNLGTSSSYCMPAFGQTLGATAVGVFASDKPDADAVSPSALTPTARSSLDWAKRRYQDAYHQAMSSHALSGFSNATALFAYVLPRAGKATTTAVAQAAQVVKLPVGSLANGGGIDIAPPGAADAGNNRNAAGVIWEWIAPGQEAVVWPPAFATHPVVWMPIDR